MLEQVSVPLLAAANQASFQNPIEKSKSITYMLKEPTRTLSSWKVPTPALPLAPTALFFYVLCQCYEFLRLRSKMDQQPVFIPLIPNPGAELLPCFANLGIAVNPAFSKVDNKPFCFLSGFESIRQRVNRVRVAFAIGLPSDFRACTPEFGALLKRRVGDDETIVVKQVCHFCTTDWRLAAASTINDPDYLTLDLWLNI